MFKYMKTSGEILKKMEENAVALKKIDMKKRDTLAKEFNESKDINQKEKFLKQIAVIDSEFKAWRSVSTRLDKRYSANESYYEKHKLG